jgi:hypothetical protein
MTVVVESSVDQIAALTNGGVFPVPAGVAEDNAAQAAKKEAKNDAGKDNKGSVQASESGSPFTAAAVDSPKEAKPDDKALEADDIEGEDGLTPREKREFTKSMLATIAKKHRRQKEAEELATAQYNERQLAVERAETLARENAQLKERLKPAAVAEAKAPERKDFETDQAYTDAVIDFKVDQRLKVKAAEDAQRANEQAQQELRARAVARIERAIELVPDFKEVTEAVDWPTPPVVATYMQKSPLFAELGYYLAAHPEAREKIDSLSPDEQLVEIGEIKSRLQPFAKAEPAAKVDDGATPSQETAIKVEPETGSAPSKPRVQAPIIKPLSSGSATQVGKDEAQMSSGQVVTAWQKKHGVVLTARKRH